jgi:hypothetical protein
MEMAYRERWKAEIGGKEYFVLGFFHGALLKNSRMVLVHLGQVHAGRVMKFASA